MKKKVWLTSRSLMSRATHYCVDSSESGYCASRISRINVVFSKGLGSSKFSQAPQATRRSNRYLTECNVGCLIATLRTVRFPSLLHLGPEKITQSVSEAVF